MATKISKSSFVPSTLYPNQVAEKEALIDGMLLAPATATSGKVPYYGTDGQLVGTSAVSATASAATVTGTLGVTSNATIGGTCGITGNTTIGGTLGVTGNVTMSGNLGVTGVLTVGSTITAISQTITYDQFTDNTDTTGYKDLTTQVPAGAIVLGWKAVTTTGFTGDTSAVIEVGKAGALTAFSTTTNGSVFGAGTVGSATVLATAFCAAATTVRVTVTSASDFTSVAAGSTTVTVFYIS